LRKESANFSHPLEEVRKICRAAIFSDLAFDANYAKTPEKVIFSGGTPWLH
jgi:hypothetical protein